MAEKQISRNPEIIQENIDLSKIIMPSDTLTKDGKPIEGYIPYIFVHLLKNTSDFKGFLQTHGITLREISIPIPKIIEIIDKYSFSKGYMFLGPIVGHPRIQYAQPFERFRRHETTLQKDSYLYQLFPHLDTVPITTYLFPGDTPHVPTGNATVINRDRIFINEKDIHRIDIIENEFTSVILERLGLLKGINISENISMNGYGIFSIQQGMELLSDIVSIHRQRQESKSIADFDLLESHLAYGMRYAIAQRLSIEIKQELDNNYGLSRFVFFKAIFSYLPSSYQSDFDKIVLQMHEALLEVETSKDTQNKILKDSQEFTARMRSYIKKHPTIDTQIQKYLDNFAHSFVQHLQFIQSEQRKNKIFNPEEKK